MLIECLIERDGHSVVNVQRSKYEFFRNEAGDQVCDVISQSHSDYLLKLPDFRLYGEMVTEKLLPKFVCEKCQRGFSTPGGFGKHKKACI